MTSIALILETITELANERSIDEHQVKWHDIAIRLADKLVELKKQHLN